MRERICLNGLWAALPVHDATVSLDAPPAKGAGWGWFKVPGIWPREAARDVGEAAQRLLIPPRLEAKLAEATSTVDQMWQRRTFSVPATWKGRRAYLDFTMVQTHAKIFVDGTPAGEVWFPGGRVDITDRLKPGAEQEVAILVTARPLEGGSQLFMAPDRIQKNKTELKLKGLTGDVFLVGEPLRSAIDDVRITTSTRAKTITFDLDITDLDIDAARFKLSAVVTKLDDASVSKTFTSEILDQSTVKGGTISFTAAWADPDLWETDSPNLYEAVARIETPKGGVIDESFPIRFGFREFWIDGRDFYLNGTRIHLRALLSENISDQADRSCAAGCATTLVRMRDYGFNFLITSNYSFAPGEVGYMDGLFDACDSGGMLAAFTLPHAKDFGWKLDDPAKAEAYRKLCGWLIRRARQHPSIILYAMNHNATGYYGDQNPLKIDGLYNPESAADGKLKSEQGSLISRRRQAMTAANIAAAIDPTRPVYHHESGNLGPLHTANTYLNWAPRQERSDWFAHWSQTGIKPLFVVEWGLPHIASWSSYRGPEFIWEADVFQSVWASEFAAPVIGQQAYRMTPEKIKLIDEEERLWATGKPFRYPAELVSNLDDNYTSVQAWYASDNWRAIRTWGVSAILPWDQGSFWRRIHPGRTLARAAPYTDLQRPGITPDVTTSGRQYIYDNTPDNFAPTALAAEMLRWNKPLIMYIGGSEKAGFSDKAHVFEPGEKGEKRLVIVNDTRQARQCSYRWRLDTDGSDVSGEVRIEPGTSAFEPLLFTIPEKKSDSYSLVVKATFDNGETLTDAFALEVVDNQMDTSLIAKMRFIPALRDRLELDTKVGLFDPKGVTTKLFEAASINYYTIETLTSLQGDGIVAIGRNALSDPKVRFDADAVRDGVRVVVFEQNADTLLDRFGFRVNVLGVREVHPRLAHPALKGLEENLLRDWRGASTLTAPRLDVEAFERADPKLDWCGFENTRVWRCGNRGNVASVLIEKPERGDWLPIVDCGFDLQYSPLLEYSEGKGKVVFCQMDVSGRTENEPAAIRLCRDLLTYLDKAKNIPERPTFYIGAEKCRNLLNNLGVHFTDYDGRNLGGPDLLIVGPGGGKINRLSDAFEKGITVVFIGLNTQELTSLLGNIVACEDRPTLAGFVEDFNVPEYAGLSNADLHWRTRPTIAALTSPAADLGGNEALRVIRVGKGKAILCQAAPWHFDYAKKPYLRSTFRRNCFLLSRLLATAGATFSTPLLDNLGKPAKPHKGSSDGQWLQSYYLQKPIADDDPYRYYRW